MAARIGITARYRPAIRSFSVHEGYVDEVARAGGLPIIVPFGDVSQCDPIVRSLDGVMLTGGEDVDPSRWGGPAQQDGYRYYPERDDFEIHLARTAMKYGLPVLGICRGCQILHVAAGHTLIPHVPDTFGDLVAHRKSIAEPSLHFVTLVEESRVANAYAQQRLLVTSYHHQGLHFDANMDSSWRVAARADDSLIEAIEYVGDSWVVGVLWHPELPAQNDSGHSDPLISAFVGAARGG